MNTSSPVLTRPTLREQFVPNEILVAIAPDIANIPQLVAGVRPGVSVLVLDTTEDAISQISNSLQQFSNPVSLHLIAHGSTGCVKLGATRLSTANLEDWAQKLQTWQGQVREILLYSCEVAISQGKDFVNQLAALTGATVAASETLTGSETLGGNWNLEYATGEIQSPSAFHPEVLAAYEGIFFDRTVNNVTELIQAINEANSNGLTLDTIRLVAGITYTLTDFFRPVGRSDFQVFPGQNIGTGRGFAGLPKITSEIVIDGNGATISRSAAAPDFRIFYVDGQDGVKGNLTLNNITLSGGRATTPTVPNSVNSGNDGGAIWNSGIVTVNKGIIEKNYAEDDGGGFANFGVLTLNDSTVRDNEAKGAINPPNTTDNGSGGGIDNRSDFGPGELYISNTTITGNKAKTSGGGVSNTGTKFIRENSPIEGNTSAAAPDISGKVEGSNIVIRDGSTLLPDNASGVVDLGSIRAGDTRKLIIANTGSFKLDIDKITLPNGVVLAAPAPVTIAAPTAPATETTQDLVLAGFLQDAGVFTGALSIESNDGDNKENPYNFTFKITVNGPEINVFDPSNNDVPTGTGAFNFGSVAPGATFPFTIKNTGTETLNLSNLQLPNGLVVAGTFPTSIAPGESAALPLQIAPDFIGALNGTIRFTSNDNNEKDYEFAIAGTVTVSPPPVPQPPVPQPPVPIPTVDKLTNVGDNIFVIGRNGGASLEFQVRSREAFFVSEMGVFRVGANNEILDVNGNSTGIAPGNPNYQGAALANGNTIFSSISNFDYSNRAVTRIMPGLSDGSSPSLSKFNAGDRLVFYFISNGTADANLTGRAPSGTPLLGSTLGQGRFQALRANEVANGEYLLSWEDRPGGDADFNDLRVLVRQTAKTAPAGATLQGSAEGEFLDLRAFNGAKTVRFNVLENEALFKNQVGLYRVDLEGQILNPKTGAATGVKVGAGNYKDVALANRIEGLNLTNGAGAADFQLQGGDNGLYAPFIIANGDASNVFFPFLGANSDGVDHVRLLGDNLFGFEDYVGGLDFDYNDFTFQATVIA